MSSSPATIRPASESDAPLVLRFIRELAEYERLLDHVTATEDGIRDALFGAQPAAEAFIAELDGEPVGFAVIFHNFSTFEGRRTLYLEDLYVRPSARGRGIGRQLLTHLAALARARGCPRLEWSVLDWNEPAIGFYRRLGAVPMDAWTVYRLHGEALEALAREQDAR
jgi:GNAT superfamily N-acetyltransferase